MLAVNCVFIQLHYDNCFVSVLPFKNLYKLANWLSVCLRPFDIYLGFSQDM